MLGMREGRRYSHQPTVPWPTECHRPGSSNVIKVNVIKVKPCLHHPKQRGTLAAHAASPLKSGRPTGCFLDGRLSRSRVMSLFSLSGSPKPGLMTNLSTPMTS